MIEKLNSARAGWQVSDVAGCQAIEIVEVDDLRFRLHLPNDLADLFLRQLGLGER
jgi:hypothetical protein